MSDEFTDAIVRWAKALDNGRQPVLGKLPDDYKTGWGEGDYEDRIAELEAQVGRLQYAFTEAHGYVEEEGFFLHDHPYHERWGLLPGDLDPMDTPETST